MAIETEAQRQFYLGMAGIHCWYARSPQPGAAASPVFDFAEPETDKPDIAAPLQLPTARRDKQGQRKAAIAGVRDLMTDAKPAGSPPAPLPKQPRKGAGETADLRTPPVEAKSADVPQQPAPPQPAQSKAEHPSVAAGDNQFVAANWGFWSAGPWLLVSTLSTDASHQLQESLARNILKALAANVESTSRLQWPVFNNPAVPGNDRAGLKALLQDLRRDRPDQRVIALGLCQGEDWPDRSEWLASALGEPVVDFEYSLPALATDPGRKRALWSRLRPLVASGD